MRQHASTAFAPITHVASVANVLVVHPDLPARSVRELIALLKKDKLAYASGGAGGSQHLSGELFKSMSGTDMVHVPYKGGAAALTDLLAGRVPIMFCNLPVCLPHIQSGKLVALGVTSARQSELLPQVPTLVEAGLPGYVVDGWFGLFAPAAVPEPILDRRNQGTCNRRSSPARPAVVSRMNTNCTPIGSVRDCSRG